MAFDDEVPGRSLFKRSRHPYYIIAPDYTAKSAGIRCLYELCHALNECGEEAYIAFSHQSTPYLRAPLLRPENVEDHFVSGRFPIGVLAEVYSGNPLKLPVVARWLLNKPGHLSGAAGFQKTDLVFAYDDWVFDDDYAPPMLSIPTTDSRVFHNRDNPQDLQREGFCYYAHKALTRGIEIDPGLQQGISLCHDIPRSHEEIAAILRRSGALFCYENTALIHEALACGCPVLIVPSDYWAVAYAAQDVLCVGADGAFVERCGHGFSDARKDTRVAVLGDWEAHRFGGNEYIEFDYSEDFCFGTGDLTIEAWVYFVDGAAADSQIFIGSAFSQWGSNHWVFGKRRDLGGRVGFRIGNFDGEFPLDDPQLPDSGRWMHYAVVRRRESFGLFRDGVLVCEQSFSGPVNTHGSGIVLGIASDDRRSFNGLNGGLGGVRIRRGEAAYRASFVPERVLHPTCSGHIDKVLHEPGVALATDPEGLDWARATLGYSSLLVDAWNYFAWNNIREFIRLTQQAAAKASRVPALPPELASPVDEAALWKLPESARPRFLEAFHSATAKNSVLRWQFDGERIEKERQDLRLRDELDYAKWVDRHALQECDTVYFQEHVRTLWKKHLFFELVLIAHAGQEAAVAETLASLQAQFYNGWRLTVVADFPPPSDGNSAQLRWLRRDAGRPLGEFILQEVVLSGADWFAFLPCGMRFAEQLFLVLSDYLSIRPEWKAVYFDHDLLKPDGGLFEPQFKPDFNIDLYRAFDYIGAPFFSRDTLLSCGVFGESATAIGYDALLRLHEQIGPQAIGHISEILLHCPEQVPWQATNTEACASLTNHAERNGIALRIAEGAMAGVSRQIDYVRQTDPRVSVIVAASRLSLSLVACLEALLSHTDYPDWELLLAIPGSALTENDERARAMSERLGERLLIVAGEPAGRTALLNRAAGRAGGEYLVLLDETCLVAESTWLNTLMNHGQRGDIAAVGPRLVSAHADVAAEEASDGGPLILGLGGTLGPAFADEPAARPERSADFRAVLEQNCSALDSRCLLIRKALFLGCGGFDESLGASRLADGDLCLRLVQDTPCRLLWTPQLSVTLDGDVQGAAAKREPADQQAVHVFVLRWMDRLAGDPLWNRNLSLLSSRPRIETDLVAAWNPDFRDRLRALWLPLASQGQAEYRCLGPMRALNRASLVQGVAACQPADGHDRSPLPVELARLKPDVLVMHAPVDDVRFTGLMHLHALNKDVLRIYSLDDLITRIPVDSYVHRQLPAQLIEQRMKHGLAACHRLIVSTEPLREACREYIDDIRVVPNMLDADLWLPLVSRRRQGPKIRVGWAGGQQHAGDLRFLAEVVRATSAQVDWVFLGMAPQGVNEHIAEYHDFTTHYSEYPAKLAALDLDLAVAPLDPHPFNEAKSNLRLLEYGVLGWPVICSDAYPYRTGNPPVTRLKNEAKCWIEAILDRAASPGALAAEGAALRQWVLKDYVLQNRLDVWVSALRP